MCVLNSETKFYFHPLPNQTIESVETAPFFTLVFTKMGPNFTSFTCQHVMRATDGVK